MYRVISGLDDNKAFSYEVLKNKVKSFFTYFDLEINAVTENWELDNIEKMKFGSDACLRLEHI